MSISVFPDIFSTFNLYVCSVPSSAVTIILNIVFSPDNFASFTIALAVPVSSIPTFANSSSASASIITCVVEFATLT